MGDSGDTIQYATDFTAKMAILKEKQKPDFNNVVRIAGNIVAPGNFEIQRFRNDFSCVPTAAAAPKRTLKKEWNLATKPVGYDTNMNYLTDDMSAIFIFRNHLRNTIHYDLNPKPGDDNCKFRYLAHHNASSPSPNVLAINPGEERDLRPYSWHYSPGGTITDPNAGGTEWAPHGPILYPGEDDTRNGVWIDAVDNVNPGRVFLTSTVDIPVGENVRLYVYKYNGGAWAPAGTSTIPAGTLATASFNGAAALYPCVVPINEPDYYAFKVENNCTISVGIQICFVSDPAQGSSWAHLPMGGLLPSNIQNFSEIRIMSGSIFIQNEAAELVKQGNICQAQISGGQDWFHTLANVQDPGLFDVVASYSQTRVGQLAKGGYSFLKPTSEDDFDYHRDSLVAVLSNGIPGVTQSAFDLRTPNDYLCIVMSAGTPGAGDVMVTIQNAVEYKTNNLWLERQIPDTTEAEWRLAMRGVATMVQHYENEIHWRSILRTLGSIASAAAPVVAAFGPYGQAAATALTGLGAASKLLPEDAPAARTLKRKR